MIRVIHNESNRTVKTLVFSDAFLTCVNTEAAALRRGAPSPATARERDTLERHVTTVSSWSHVHFFTLGRNLLLQPLYRPIYSRPTELCHLVQPTRLHRSRA